MGVKCGLNHKKIQDISKITWRSYHLQKRILSIHGYQEKAVDFKNNIKYYGLVFHYNVCAYPMLIIGYVDIKHIPCSCYACLSKLAFPCNIVQDKYNKDQYKVGNQQCVHWPILGSCNNYHIIHCIDSKNNMNQPALT